MFKKIWNFILKLFRPKKCYYINSSNVLPPPLEAEEEKELLLKTQEGDIEARNILLKSSNRLKLILKI